MTEPQRFIDPGVAEAAKGAVHGGLLVIAAICDVYNIAAWLVRRKRHLAINVGVYSAIVYWEGYQVYRHCQEVVHESGDSPARVRSVPPLAVDCA